ncbi:hypothetical protein clem_10455 [Legionella clemsonensis]|uniref:Uncharacterized protein n=1 Tax=Legionella clemsonensis TaxID=1867846 RepID=A0A222P489_9GAMM|nr:hypothetical protein clem_10455 [Legionella clemsonensis]
MQFTASSPGKILLYLNYKQQGVSLEQSEGAPADKSRSLNERSFKRQCRFQDDVCYNLLHIFFHLVIQNAAKPHEGLQVEPDSISKRSFALLPKTYVMSNVVTHLLIKDVRHVERSETSPNKGSFTLLRDDRRLF